jgi:F5/8 type C domain/Glutamine amidotransferase class-I
MLFSRLCLTGFLAVATFCPQRSSSNDGVELVKRRPSVRATASTTSPVTSASGAVNDDRFSVASSALWQGKAGEGSWWWQIEFAEPRSVGAILQIQGDHAFAFKNAPRQYIWQGSQDGIHWEDWEETRTAEERRMFRIHRLKEARRVRWLRLLITRAEGSAPALREVEVYANPTEKIDFPEWAVAVSTTGQRQVPGEGGAPFRKLAQSCEGWEGLQVQNVWLGDFHREFVETEPRPLCGFLSGNFIDWCQQDRSHWRGVAEILRWGELPIWASCGGMQGLAVLAESGVDEPWDCPQCRDPKNPKTPIYTHITGSVRRACGDYSGCVFERGPHVIHQLMADPVFSGLPPDFRAMESHCGQIEWAPKGWVQIASHGDGGKTKMQCLRVKDRPIYAAQFHIEMEGTPESSRTIMTNFLGQARLWADDRSRRRR